MADESQDVPVQPQGQDAGQAIQSRLEEISRDRMTRRAALAKIGFRAGAAILAALSVDDLARMAGKQMDRQKSNNEAVNKLAREFKNAGVAFADEATAYYYGIPSPCKNPHSGAASCSTCPDGYNCFLCCAAACQKDNTQVDKQKCIVQCQKDAKCGGKSDDSPCDKPANEDKSCTKCPTDGECVTCCQIVCRTYAPNDFDKCIENCAYAAKCKNKDG